MASTRISNLGNLIYAGSKLVFKEALKKQRVMEYPDIVLPKTSDKQQEYYQTVGNIPVAQIKPEGAPISTSRIDWKDQTTVTNQTVANGFSASLEATKDDLYGVVDMAKAEGLVRSMIAKKELMVAAMYNGAFADTGGDGVATISDSHPLKNSASVNDNLVTGGLTTANIKAGLNQFNVILDQAGTQFDTAATHLVINKDKLFDAMELFQSALLAFELSNTTNSIKGALKIVPNRRLTINRTTGVAPWFMLDKSLPDCGLILQEREGISTDYEFDLSTLQFNFYTFERYGLGFISAGYGIVGSAGT